MEKQPHSSSIFRTLALFIFMSLWLLCGCSLPDGLGRSRWALDHPVYAEKYADGAKKTDILGKLKQASDARFVSGDSGLYASTGFAARSDDNQGLFGIEAGIESYDTSYLTSRVALSLFANEDDHYIGASTGVRLQVPSRLAPFVGIGAFVGTAEESIPAADDGVDNNDDGFIDERGEEEERFSGALASIFPEVGAHFWLTPRVRVSGFGRYQITTEGRDADDWLIGTGIAVFSGGQ